MDKRQSGKRGGRNFIRNQRDEAYRTRINAIVDDADVRESLRAGSGRASDLPKVTRFKSGTRTKMQEAARARIRAQNDDNIASKQVLADREHQYLGDFEKKFQDLNLRDHDVVVSSASKIRLPFAAGPLIQLPVLDQSAVSNDPLQPYGPVITDIFQTARLVADRKDNLRDYVMINDQCARDFWEQSAQSTASTVNAATCFQSISNPLGPEVLFEVIRFNDQSVRDSVFEQLEVIPDPNETIPTQTRIDLERQVESEVDESERPRSPAAKRKRGIANLLALLNQEPRYVLHLPAYLFYVPDARLTAALMTMDEALMRANPAAIDLIVDRVKRITGFQGSVIAIRVYRYYQEWPGISSLTPKDRVRINLILSPLNLSFTSGLDGLNDDDISIAHSDIIHLLRENAHKMRTVKDKILPILKTPSKGRKYMRSENPYTPVTAWQLNSPYVRTHDAWLNELLPIHSALPNTVAEVDAGSMLFSCVFGIHNISTFVEDEILRMIGPLGLPLGTTKFIGQRKNFVTCLCSKFPT